MISDELRLLMTTFSEEQAAAAAVRQLLEESLIACGTILPGAHSIYRWQGKIEEASESIVLMKTDLKNATRCMERLQELHPYEVPEILLLNPETVSKPYLSWVREVLG